MLGSIQSSICHSVQANSKKPMPHNCYFWLLPLSESQTGVSKKISRRAESHIKGCKSTKCNLRKKKKKQLTTKERGLWASFQLITSRKRKELLLRVSALARWPQKLSSLALPWNQSNQKWRGWSSAMATMAAAGGEGGEPLRQAESRPTGRAHSGEEGSQDLLLAPVPREDTFFWR